MRHHRAGCAIFGGCNDFVPRTWKASFTARRVGSVREPDESWIGGEKSSGLCSHRAFQTAFVAPFTAKRSPIGLDNREDPMLAPRRRSFGEYCMSILSEQSEQPLKRLHEWTREGLAGSSPPQGSRSCGVREQVGQKPRRRS